MIEKTSIMIKHSKNEIRTRPHPDCYLCRTKGVVLYHGLKDRLFGAPGKWNLKKCPECGLLWLDPMPLEEDIGKAYENYYTHNHAENTDHRWPWRIYSLVREAYFAQKYSYHLASTSSLKRIIGMLAYLHPGVRAKLDTEILCLPARPNGHLLEVGFGDAKMLILMNELGWSVEGVDLDPVAVQRAKDRGLRVRLGAIENQEYSSNQFDAVVMRHLIEHVPDPLKTLYECRRILKPGGQLVALTPNGESWGHKLFRNNWRGLEPPRHLYLFTLLSLRHLLEKAGFQEFELSSSIQGAHLILRASRSIRNTGTHATGSPEPPITRIWSWGMQLLEWAILKMRADVGEEIVLLARK
ncbi:MAG: class I SAM-dependent methyltransferase [Desulfobacteraceae bacterium]|nr:class I SAM-dependent methyltransferase [Desulfobacteraceae bacterium]